MIAQRFRPVMAVAGVATAITMLYMISLKVASERSRLEAVEHRIASVRRDIRQFQTELDTRGSLRQLERWNGDVLALSAPQAKQFLTGEQQIASISGDNLGDVNAPPPAVMAAAAEQDIEVAVANDAVAPQAVAVAVAAALPPARTPEKPALAPKTAAKPEAKLKAKAETRTELASASPTPSHKRAQSVADIMKALGARVETEGSSRK